MGRSRLLRRLPRALYGSGQWIATLGLKGLGVDMISIDGPDTTEFPVHRIILGAGMVAVENLTALRQVGERPSPSAASR